VTPRAFLTTLLKGYAVVIGTIVIAVAIAIVFLVTQQTSFRSSAVVQVKVAVPADASAKTLAAAGGYANYRTVTEKALVTTDRILDPVIAALNLPGGPRQLAEHVIPISAADTNLIEIRVDWPNAARSADISNAIARQLVDDSATQGSSVKVEITQVTAARAATSPVVPNPAETVGLAVLAALLLSSVWLFVRRLRRAPSSYTEA